MLKYYTQQRRLILPNMACNMVQQMVEHCLTIEDHGERNACAVR